jgi:penicillin-binding protein-related factor A (putative recombinase)
MILYNVTIKVHSSINNEWLQWLKEEHINEVMETNCFTSHKILRLLEIDEAEGPTYAIQYFAESKALYNLYIEKFASEMRNRSFAKWGDKFIAFRSVMQIVD